MDTLDFLYTQPSYDTADNVDLASFDPIKRVPLGFITHGRSGDKGSDCNVGVLVRNEDEYNWLRSTLNIGKVQKLIGDDYIGKPIQRFELPNILGKLH